MLPEGFRESEHDNHCRIINPQNGATITGEGGDNIGRGGRKSIYFVDEAAFLERPGKVEASLSQNTRCRIWVSTPNGPGNPFAKKRFSGNIEVFTFHWRDDPRKDDLWYARQVAEIDDPVVIAQEIDIDYTASIEGICIPAKWVRAAVGLELPRSGERVAGFDIAEEGRNKNAFILREGPVVEPPVVWSQLNTTQTAHKASGEGKRLSVARVNYDCDGVGAGVKGAWESADEPLPFKAHAIRGGGSPSEDRWPDGKTSKERFLNLRAEMWWKLRLRFERTFEYVDEGIAHPPDSLISIPNDSDLIAQLSQPLAEQTVSGKIKIESKVDMRKRGVNSPDLADALAYTEAPVRLTVPLRF